MTLILNREIWELAADVIARVPSVATPYSEIASTWRWTDGVCGIKMHARSSGLAQLRGLACGISERVAFDLMKLASF